MTAVLRRLASPAVLTPPLLVCYALCAAVHLVSVSLSTLLPFHVVDLGGSRTQVGLLFSITTIVSMVLRPGVGSWLDAVGARPVVLPGLAMLGVVSLALHLPRRPETVILVMSGAGIAYALVNTSYNVLTARAAASRHRGEALSLYYLASSLAIALAPPGALALRRFGGMPLAFVVVTVLVAVMVGLALALPPALTAARPGARPGFRVFSRHAIPVAGALVLTTIGHSSIYAFLPLYAVSRGHGATVVWFFAVYSGWLIVCRAFFAGVSDRVGRGRIAVPAMAVTALAYLMLALPPSPASLMVAALLLGTGGSVLYPTLVALVLDRTPDAERGVALGSVSSAWDLGVVLGSALIGFVSDHVSFGAGFALAGVAAGLGAVAFVVTERRAPGTAMAPAT